MDARVKPAHDSLMAVLGASSKPAAAATPLLAVEELSVSFATDDSRVAVVEDVSFEVPAGGTVLVALTVNRAALGGAAPAPTTTLRVMSGDTLAGEVTVQVLPDSVSPPAPAVARPPVTVSFSNE